MSKVVKPVRSVSLENAVILLTGAEGGIGTALLNALLAAGAKEVIAAGRTPPPAGPCVTPVTLDITDAASVGEAAALYSDRVDILINNAGVNGNGRILTDNFISIARQEFEVNYFGLLHMLGAFAPAMRERRSGSIVNLLTVLSHVNLPLMASYCASKAAAHSITQAARAELSPFGVNVCGVYPAVVDTPMSSHVSTPKLSPAQLALDILEAIRSGVEDVYPGAATQVYHQYLTDPKQVEHGMAQRLNLKG